MELIVPIRHSILVKMEFNTFTTTRLQIADLGKGFQLQRRVGDIRKFREGDVKLDDFGSYDWTDVRNGH
jgi:hypothetical protein